MDGRIALGLGFGLVLDVLGVLLVVSGSAAAGIAVLAISSFIVFGIILSRRGGPGRRGRYVGGGSFGGMWAGDGDDGDGGDGGGSGGFGGGSGGSGGSGG